MLDHGLIVRTLLGWFDVHERPLPWRRTSPWGVFVSEIMLQQTPVSRVLPLWQEWLHRWPNPSDLAGEPSSAAVARWGRLGYPRRALRLHAAAAAITEQHAGQVPADLADLRRLPGVGQYTAAAVASFAHGAAVPVLDTNVRRVLTRVYQGSATAPNHLTTAETDRAWRFTEAAGDRAARWAAAVMEFGALVCTARNPVCQDCPLTRECAWRAAGYPASQRSSRAQSWHGTNRQCRGALLDVVRGQPDGVPVHVLLGSWSDRTQASGALASLVADRLVQRSDDVVRL